MGTLFLISAAGYLLGSIPFGYLLVRFTQGQDIRQSGSGNIGATNVARASTSLGVMTLLLDALKGMAAVALAHVLLPGQISAAALAGFCAVVGHVFPVWLSFRGGKGVATGLGSFLLLAPKIILFAVGIFIAIVLLFRYVSLGSIIATASFPLLFLILKGNTQSPTAMLLMATASLLIIFRHRANIQRLVAGSEPRFSWSRK